MTLFRFLGWLIVACQGIDMLINVFKAYSCDDREKRREHVSAIAGCWVVVYWIATVLVHHI
jgi:hypothetical protein